MAVTGIDATYYYVKDYDRALGFYTWLIGGEPTMAHPGMYAEWTFPGGESFGIYKGEQFAESNGAMLAVPDIHAALEACREKGCELAWGPEVEETPVCHLTAVKDTEGNSFILHQRK